MIRLLILFLSLGFCSTLFAEPTGAEEAPWDTVIASLKIIESTKEPDSVKTILTQELFSDYDIAADDYGQFYNKFLKKSPEQQLEFLNRVEKIILELMKQREEQMRKEY